MILCFEDGSTHVIDGPVLTNTLQWLRDVKAVLEAAKILSERASLQSVPAEKPV